MRFMSARIADIAHFDGFWTTRPAESRPGQRYWYIGKIDGVINYVRRMSEWTVTAALFEFGPDNEPKPIIGIVHAPALGLTYLAARRRVPCASTKPRSARSATRSCRR